MLSSAGLPLLNGFIGEFTILQGAFEANRVWAAFAVIGRHPRRGVPAVAVPAHHARARSPTPRTCGLRDLNLREMAVFLPLIAWAIWIGVYPKPYFDILEKPVAQIVERVRPGYFAAARPAAAATRRRRAPMSQFYTSTDHFVLIPAIMLALFGCAILLFDFLIFPEPKQRKYLLFFVVLGLVFTGGGAVAAAALSWPRSGIDELTAFGGSLTIDGFALFFNWIFLAASLIVALISYKYLEIEGEHHGEYYGLILLANCGMFFLAAGTDLVTLFIGLELMALCFYVMVGFLRSDKRSNEAAMKYLLLGAFSSGFLVYGFSVLYGICRFHQAAATSPRRWPPGSPRTRWCSWRWRRPRSGCCSRFPPCRSTCGRRTPTKARRPR